MDLYWIDSSLAISSRPRGEDWLEDEMADLRRQGVNLVVSCLTRPEEREIGLIDEEQAAQRLGLTFIRSPMEDRTTPADVVGFEKIINRLLAERHSGRKVAIHCRQGLGRAPLVAASLLVRSGMKSDAAWSLIAERRQRDIPDTEEQREWVRSFARRGSTAKVLTQGRKGVRGRPFTT